MAGWNATNELIVGQGGELYIADTSGTVTAPTTSVSNLGNEWYGLGFLDADGVTLTVTPNVQEFTVWQSRQPARRESLAQEIQTSAKVAQFNTQTMPFAYGGGVVSGSGSAWTYTFPLDTDALDENALIVDVTDQPGGTTTNYRFYWKRGNVTEPVETVFNRSNLGTLAIGFKALAPSGGGSPGSFFTNSANFGVGS